MAGPLVVVTGANSGIGLADARELADIVLYCWKLPPHICVRDIVVTPTRTTF